MAYPIGVYPEVLEAAQSHLHPRDHDLKPHMPYIQDYPFELPSVPA